MERKFFYIFLIILISLTAPCLAANRADLLSEAGALKIWDAGNLKGDRFVTRAEFISLIVTAVKMDNINADVIEAARDLGFVDNPGGRFYPHDYISYEDAVKIIVRAAQYDIMAAGKGYIAAAADAGLLRNTRPDAYLTRDDAVTLAYNLLTVNLKIRDVFGGQNIAYSKPGENLLEKLWEIKKYSGKVESNEIVTLTGVRAVKDCVIIGGTSFFCGNTNTGEYIGLTVDYYFTDDSGVKTLVYAEPRDFSETVISGYDVKNESASAIEYSVDDGGKYQKVHFSGDCVIVKNHQVTPYYAGIFSGKSTRVRAVSTDGGSACDLVFVDVFATYVVDYADPARKIIYPNAKDGMNPIKSDLPNMPLIDLSDVIYKITGFAAGSGGYIDIEDLYEGNVIEVSTDITGKYCEIKALYNTALSGKVIEISDDGIVFDDGTVTRTLKIADDRNFEFKIGDGFVVYTDIDGKIAGFKRNDENVYIYGYLADYIRENSIDGRILVKIFNQNGELNLHYTAKNLKVNGSPAGNSMTVPPNQMIAYKENRFREISEIYTAAEDRKNYPEFPDNFETPAGTGEPLTRNDNFPDAEPSNFTYVIDNRTLSNGTKRFSLGEDTVIFFVSSRNKGENMADPRYPDVFRIYSGLEMQNYMPYYVKIYQATDMMRAKIVVVSAPEYTERYNTNVILVDKTAYVINGQNPDKLRVYGYIDGRYSFRDVKTGVKFSAKAGDILEVRTNYANEVVEVTGKIYKSGDPVVEKHYLYSDGYASGNVSECDSTGIVLESAGSGGVFYPFGDPVRFYEFDENGGLVKSGDRNSVHPGFSKVFLYIFEYKVSAVIVVR
jgi:hypothetical protein